MHNEEEQRMKMIKWASGVIAGNIDEASRYIKHAYAMHDECRMAADWCRDMAATHLSFNQNGHELVKKLKESVSIPVDIHSHYTSGMSAVWEDRHAELMSEAAEVKAMIDNYK